MAILKQLPVIYYALKLITWLLTLQGDSSEHYIQGDTGHAAAVAASSSNSFYTAKLVQEKPSKFETKRDLVEDKSTSQDPFCPNLTGCTCNVTTGTNRLQVSLFSILWKNCKIRSFRLQNVLYYKIIQSLQAVWLEFCSVCTVFYLLLRSVTDCLNLACFDQYYSYDCFVLYLNLKTYLIN